MTFSITSIPAIMRSQGWLNGAALMDRWIAGAPSAAPIFGPPDTQTIRMSSWVLTFPRARAVYDQLMRDRIRINAAAKKEIATLLRGIGMLTPVPQSRPFGNLSLPARISIPTTSTSGWSASAFPTLTTWPQPWATSPSG